MDHEIILREVDLKPNSL